MYRDTIPDEADGRLYLSLLNRDGTVALHDVAAEISSPLLQQGDKLGAAAVNLLLELDDEGRPQLAIPPAAVGGLAPYTHTKSGRVHALTGEGENLRFVAAAPFEAGDSIQVNGRACTAKTAAGDALWGGFWSKGAVVSCLRQGDSLTFSGAGLSAADKAQLVPGNLLEGIKLHSGGVEAEGAIPRKPAARYTPGREDQVLAAGQYLEGAQTILGDPALEPGNIRSGASIFGVAGSHVSALTVCAWMLLVAEWDNHDSFHARTGAGLTGEFSYMGNVVYGNGLRCNTTGRYYVFRMVSGQCGCSLGAGWQTIQAGTQITMGPDGPGHGEGLLVICKLT